MHRHTRNQNSITITQKGNEKNIYSIFEMWVMFLSVFLTKGMLKLF